MVSIGAAEGQITGFDCRAGWVGLVATSTTRYLRMSWWGDPGLGVISLYRSVDYPRPVCRKSGADYM